MATTRSQGSDRTGEREPLFGDARTTDAQAQGDNILNEDVSSEHVVVKVISVMICFGSIGLYTASIGALIPLLETYYKIQDATVAWIFVVQVIGYLLGAATLESIHLFAGRRGLALTTAGLQILGIAILATKPIYSIALLAYFLFGIGTGCSDAGFCAWAANVRDTNAVQGLIHGSYSVGCIIGPMIVAALEKAGFGWNMFYMIMLGAFGIDFCTLLFAFRHDDGQAYRVTTRPHESEVEVTLAEGKRPIIYCALFYLCYVGIETSFTDWLVTFMSRSRNSSTYIAALTSSMFWGGMSIGRFTLGLAKAAGLRLIVIIYIILSLASQVLFRFHFHVAVSLSLAASIGFSFGPMFPAGIIMLTSQLPKSLQVRACSIAASVGQLGGAGAPFLLGLVAQSLGIERLLDLVLVMSVLLLLIWLGFSNPPLKPTKPLESED
ncbi:hypothetical protein B7463_g1180, partial [Scytalidium lignicola]